MTAQFFRALGLDRLRAADIVPDGMDLPVPAERLEMAREVGATHGNAQAVIARGERRTRCRPRKADPPKMVTRVSAFFIRSFRGDAPDGDLLCATPRLHHRLRCFCCQWYAHDAVDARLV
jgi:hypothetical protein